MKLRNILFLLALLPINFSLQAGVWDNISGYFQGKGRSEPPTIRVLLVHDAEGVNLQVRGRYSLYDPYSKSHISSRFAGKSRYIQAMGDGLKWGESFPGLYQLKIEPDDNATLIAINDRDYDGLVYVYDIGGSISIVNEIPVEDFVRSIMANPQNENLAPETLAALAIVARTNAYYQAVNPKNTYWAVDAQKVGFNGRPPLNTLAEEAVKQTRYMLMSRTGVYEGVATPFPAQFGNLPMVQSKELQVSKITLEEANAMAKKGEHAAQILAKAFPNSTIMLMQYAK